MADEGEPTGVPSEGKKASESNQEKTQAEKLKKTDDSKEITEAVKRVEEKTEAVGKKVEAGFTEMGSKLENIEKKIEESTTLILQQMRLSKDEERELRRRLTEELAGGVNRLDVSLKAIANSLEAKGDTEGRDSAALLEASRAMETAAENMRSVGDGMKTAFTNFEQTQKETTKAFKDFTDAEYQQLLYQQGQLPPELQVPTIEIVAMKKLREEGQTLSYEAIQARAKDMLNAGPDGISAYEKHIEGWYKRTVREVESFNTTFEERPQHLSPLLLAVTHLELRPETRALGERLRRNLEARRVNKSMARVWDIALPDQIGGAASQMHLTTLKELFTSEIDKKTGKSKVADAFREYEKRGNEIGDLNLRINKLQVEERRIAEQRDRKGKFKKLSSKEQADLKTLTIDRAELERIRSQKINEIKRLFTDGGDANVRQRDGNGIILKDKDNKPLTKTVSIKEGIEELEETRKEIFRKKEEEAQRLLSAATTNNEREKLQQEIHMLEVLRNRRKNGEIEKDSKEDKMLANLEKKPEFRKIVSHLRTIDSIDEEHEGLEDRRQAMILGGGIYRYSFRSARRDIPYMTGNFFSSRALNLGGRVEARFQLTKGIVTPSNPDNKFYGETLDFGGQDFFENLFLEKAKVSAPGTPKSSEGPAVRGALTKRELDKDYLKDKYKIKITQKPGQKAELNLENAQLENPELWDDLLTKYEVVDNWYVADQVDMYIKIDKETRAAIWPAGTFFQDPNVDSLLELKKTLTHMNDGDRKKKLGEIIERSEEWFRTDPDAKEAVEDLLVFKESEKFVWIEEASKAEMITNEFRDQMLEKYLDLGFPPFGSPREKAQTRVLLDNFFAAYRWAPMRNDIMFGTFWEWFKRAMRYALAEELPR